MIELLETLFFILAGGRLPSSESCCSMTRTRRGVRSRVAGKREGGRGAPAAPMSPHTFTTAACSVDPAHTKTICLDVSVCPIGMYDDTILLASVSSTSDSERRRRVHMRRHTCKSSSIAATVVVYVCLPIIVIVNDDAFVGSRDETVGIAQ